MALTKVQKEGIETLINNNASTKFITGTNNANELDCEANLSYNNSLVTFSSSNLLIDKSTNPTLTAKETAGNKEVQLRANTTGGLLRTAGSYPLVLGTNQTERMRIDSSGNVGIGTTSPNSFSNYKTLTIRGGTSGAGIDLELSSGDIHGRFFGDTNGVQIQSAQAGDSIRFETAGANERMRIDSSGNVGIGTTSPDAILEVTNGGTEPRLVRIHNSSSNGSAIQFTNTDTGNSTNQGYFVGLGASGDANVWHQSNFNLLFGTNNTERMRIDSSGRLLVGTTTEGEATADNLTIADSGHCGITLRSGTSSVGTIFFSDATSGGDEYIGSIQYDHSGNFLKWTTNGSERMRIDSSGKVGIGNASPQEQLHIGAADNSNHEAIIILNNGGASGQEAGIEWRYENITTPRAKIHLDSSGQDLRFATANTERMRILSGGGLTFNGDTAAANALDDYEEGTYTPTFASGMSGISYTVQSGNYVKIGKLVRFDFYIQVNGGVSNGSMIEFNLPFTSAAGTNSHRGSGVITYHNINDGNSGSIGFPALYIGTSSAQCYMGGTQWTATSGSSQSNRYFIGGGTFHAA